MKRILAAMTAAVSLFLFAGCRFGLTLPLMLFTDTQVDTYYETDLATYGEALEAIGKPAYFPETLEGYTVNSYSWTRYEYMENCVEVFLDLTVTETQMEALLTKARQTDVQYLESRAYYAEGYLEIAYEDTYYGSEDPACVGLAKIYKIVYNTETGNIVYEYFETKDTSVYQISDVVYFNHFNIIQSEYAKYANKVVV